MKKCQKILAGLIGLGTSFIPLIAKAAPKSVSEILTKGLIPKKDIYEIADIIDILGSVLRLFFTLSAVIAVIYIIIGGYYYVTAYGNPETAEKGKLTLTWAIVGLIISVLAFVIVQFVWNAIAPEAPPLPTTYNTQIFDTLINIS